MSVYPTALKLISPQELQITWSDRSEHVLSVKRLRESCPCASCREKRKATESEPPNLLPVLRPEETQPLRIINMRPVGNYAYGIHFSDGHDTGIFTLQFLRELGETN
jgi:DUF971 family protein